MKKEETPKRSTIPQDEASKISAELDQWRSPKLGTVFLGSDSNVGEMLAWMKKPDDDNDADMPTQQLTADPESPERVGTPVMSNLTTTPDDQEYPVNVKSPWLEQRSPAVQKPPPPRLDSHTHYHRYYLALLNFCRGQRSLQELYGTQHDTGDDPMEGVVVSTVNANDKRQQEELILQLDFLRSLNTLCWDDGGDKKTQKQGNFWNLLVRLRPHHGLLLWEDDPASKRQHQLALEAYQQDLVSNHHDSPEQPLILQRRHLLIQWLQDCFGRQTHAPITSTSTAVVYQNDLTTGLPETDQDAQLLHTALQLIVAGRLSEAREAARQRGVPWRAAVWTVNAENYFLWKRMLWLAAEKINKSNNPTEAAIYALLSSHWKQALDNPSLRTWEHGFLAGLWCLRDRHDDEVRARRGCDSKTKEREYLEGTSEMVGLDEADVINILATTPFVEMQCNDVVTSATAAFVRGKASVSAFLGSAPQDNDEDALCFLTHLVLYLDSLAPSTLTPVVGSSKDRLLRRYVEEVLAACEDLWYMMVLYASLLPPQDVLEVLPTYLSRLEAPNDKERIVQQLREFLTPGLDLQVLIRVVQQQVRFPDDARKMKSILWLTVDESHAGEALLASNQLLRQFVTANKLVSALALVRKVKHEKFLEIVSDALLQQDGVQVECSGNLENAQSEFYAWQVYLEALSTFEDWRQVVQEEPSSSYATETLPSRRLNQTEAAIATQLERRTVIQDKRKAMARVVQAANDAQTAFQSVLEHPGGWLFVEDATDNRELPNLRQALLPQVVQLYQDVCLQTADWLSRALDDAAKRMDDDRSAVLKALDDQQVSLSSPLSAVFWATKALDVVQLVVSDTFKIGEVFSTAELKVLLERASDAAVMTELMG